jgi:hypothetical protein
MHYLSIHPNCRYPYLLIPHVHWYFRSGLKVAADPPYFNWFNIVRLTADVPYSLGIICHEILEHEGVFRTGMRNNVEDFEIIKGKLLKVECVPTGTDQPYRPVFAMDKYASSDICEKLNMIKLIDLIKVCWSENPNDRPTASDLRRSFGNLEDGRMGYERNQSQGVKERLTGTLLTRMELHSNGLEELVKQRSKNYDAQKQKMEVDAMIRQNGQWIIIRRALRGHKP